MKRNVRDELEGKRSGDGIVSASQEAATPAASSLLVEFTSGYEPAFLVAMTELGGRFTDTLRSGSTDHEGRGDLARMTVETGVSLEKAAALLREQPGVEFVDVDWEVSVALTSNDPGYTGGSLWGMYGDDPALSPRAAPNQWGSQAEEAWAEGDVGSSSVAVGVIDTGIDYTHRDLYLNIWLNQREIPSRLLNPDGNSSTSDGLRDADADGLFTFRDLNRQSNGTNPNSAFVRDYNNNRYIDAGDLLRDSRWEDRQDTDGNGYIDDLIGWDFVNNDNDPYDDNGHGTHVAGTIGAVGGNGTGVAGVNWNVQLVPLKFLNASGSGSISNAVRAVDYFTDASILDGDGPLDFVATNNSWGGGGPSQGLLNEIGEGAAADILFIAAAGNNGRDNGQTSNYPSNYDTTGVSGATYDAVVAVASIDRTGALSSFSNYGDQEVDLGAPGSAIYSTLPRGKYGTYSGTSMATPHVTGAVALYAAEHPDYSAEQIRTALLESATATPSLEGKTEMGGRLNIGSLMDYSFDLFV